MIPMVALMVPVVLLYLANRKNETHELSSEKIYSEVFKVNDGYGYRVIYNDKILIQQEYIPVISGKLPFDSYEDANNIATVVVNRITSGEDPKVEKKDLDDLGVFLRMEN